MMRTRAPLAFLLSVNLILAGCSKKSEPDVAANGAKQAVTEIAALESTPRPNRPSAPLGIFVSLYLAEGAFLKVETAHAGVEAQMQLIKASAQPNIPDAYTLLTEFGTVLQVDIADLLNRSPDRQAALEHYMTGLGAIIVRAEKEQSDLKLSLDLKRKAVRDAGNVVSTLDRAQSEALRKKEYAAAAENQPKLLEAQKNAAGLEAEQKELQDTITTFQTLLAIGKKRQDAITENREVLIAGLKVTDVPGVEDLGVLLNGKNRNQSQRSGLMPIIGL